MKRDNKFVLRLAGLTLILAAMMLPLVQVDFSATWVTNPPIAAPDGFETRLLDYNVIIERERIVTYDNNSKTFVPHEGNTTAFSDEVDSMDLAIRLLFYSSFIISLAGIVASAFYNEKIGKVITLLGVAVTAGVVYMATLLHNAVRSALVESRMTSGNTYYIDHRFSDGVADFVWRGNAVLNFGMGYYVLIIGIILLLIGELLPTSKDVKNTEELGESTD